MKKGTRVRIADQCYVPALRNGEGAVVGTDGAYIRVRLDVPIPRKAAQLRLSDDVSEFWFPDYHVIPRDG
jgi:hypothetical protein